jgi:hypothetical protein
MEDGQEEMEAQVDYLASRINTKQKENWNWQFNGVKQMRIQRYTAEWDVTWVPKFQGNSSVAWRRNRRLSFLFFIYKLYIDNLLSFFWSNE